MPKKNYYLVLDTETATLPFAYEYAHTAKEKQNIAIAKPLVYDIGWRVIDTKGNLYKSKNYLVQETFFVPNVFNTAYYCDKRPRYMEMFAAGEITAKGWDNIVAELLEDMSTCKAVVAYNAAFDFKKAIPYTERYIHALYRGDFNKFEYGQRKACENIAHGGCTGENKDFLNPVFTLRGETCPIIDLWEVACTRLINIRKYKKFCLENEYWTPSVQYFKTSAEIAFRYLERLYDFVESHTALDDATIESAMLVKALRKGKIDPVIGSFPFRELGTTIDFAIENDCEIDKLKKALEEYTDSIDEGTSYANKMFSLLVRLTCASEARGD